MMVTLQIIDVARGAPVPRVPVELDLFITGHGWREVGRSITNTDGRVLDFGEPAAEGVYRMMIDAAVYIPDSFFPSIAIMIDVRDPRQHYPVAVLLSPFGYTVYRAP